MVRPANRSRNRRHVTRKTPGARKVVHYVERKPQRAHCSKCKKVLPGMPKARPIKMQNVSKSSKRPERPYAGILCSACMRREIISKSHS